MKTVLIVYIILINLSGFFLMGIDKRKAVRKSWRIPEKQLFTVALLLGSVGILVGMYVFHHKTRHLSFALGIPAILVFQLLGISFLFSWNRSHMSSPSQIVQHELSLIEELDAETIQAFVTYDDLTNPDYPGYSSDASSENACKAVNYFFRDFKYEICKEEIDGAAATVTVQLTNIDMKALASDLCTAILRNSVTIYPVSAQASAANDFYRLLGDAISSNSYELVTTTAYFHLQKDEQGWYILADQTLEDELVSGFISYINDPYLVSASDVLALQLDALKELDAAQWIDYLNLEDIFATYNSDFYPQIDAAYAAQLAEFFNYKILKCTESGDTATALVRVQSLDMTSVAAAYRQKLLSYAAASKSIRDDDLAFSNSTSQLLLDCLLENTEATFTDITIRITNNKTCWIVSFDADFTNALMGNLKEALSVFLESASSTQDVQVPLG